jgi:gluconate 5-dehydrogenase
MEGWQSGLGWCWMAGMYRDLFCLQDRVVLVTGAGRGIGLEIACALAEFGATVLVNGRSQAALARAVERIGASGGRALAVPADVSEDAAVDRLFGRIEAEFGRLDGLVNNAAIRDRRKVFAFARADIDSLVATNLVAPLETSRRAARLMLARNWGRIINITSIAGPIAQSGDAVYTATKGGLEALTRALAAEFGPHGITVNAIAPGFIATEANAAMVADAAIAEWLAKRSSLQRWGKPAEIAAAAVFLASPAASYVTGHVLAVDGGYLSHF